MDKIYFDHAATTKPKPEVMAAVVDAMVNHWQNPSSAYESAKEVREIVENARRIVADSIGADPEEIIFTSGASESNALAIDGWKKIETDKEKWFLTTNMEHSSIDNNTPIERGVIKNLNSGIVNIDDLRKALIIYTDCGVETLVTLGMANSEIGTIQPVKEIADIVHSFGGVFHCDCTQAYGKIPINVKEMGIDMASFSGHKIGGIKGCGFLYVRKGINIYPIIYGSQESGKRGSTYNVTGIAGLAKAVELIDFSKIADIQNVRNYLMKQLLLIDGVHINGDIVNRLPGNVNFRIDNLTINNQQMVSLLDMNGFEVSSQSACSSYSPEPSRVLKAIGLSDEEAMSSIRVTLDEENTVEEVDKFIEVIKMIIHMYGE